MRNGIQELKQLRSTVTLAQRSETPGDPGRSMGILSAVFSNPRQVPFDVTGIASCLVEGRRKQQYQLVIALDKSPVDRIHRFNCPLKIGGTREDSPRLGD